MVKKIGKYELGKTLGEGRFGKVKFAINTENGQQVAIKILVKATVLEMKAVARVKQEIAIMKKIDHHNVVKLIEVMSSPEKIYIVMELLSGGELFYKLATVQKFTEPVARRYFQQLIRGLKYCHKVGVHHRDLKPENLLLDEDDNLKISDFGLSALSDISADQSMCHTVCGTPNYVAPEVLQKHARGYDAGKADVWSCGIILHVFLTGRLPFDEATNERLYAKIKNAEFEMPRDITRGAQELLSRLLEPDPAKRVTIDEIEDDGWFQVDNVESLTWPDILSDAAAQDMGRSGEDYEPLIRKAEEQEDQQLSVAGRVITNAFELIALSGALDLTQLLQGKSLNTRRTYTRFCSNAPVKTLVKRLQGTIKEFPFQAQVNSRSLTVSVTGVTRNGMLRYTIQILHITLKWHLVDFHRDKGNILDFNNFYRCVYESCRDIIFEASKPNNDPGATVASAHRGDPGGPASPRKGSAGMAPSAAAERDELTSSGSLLDVRDRSKKKKKRSVSDGSTKNQDIQT
mmetsp:Transcript_33073/g.92626  ORF Transcript_33073/g.92626 Transcript_33073/m.92626 type:complete len:516 (+) Transcript_33073:65-1612(+)